MEINNIAFVEGKLLGFDVESVATTKDVKDIFELYEAMKNLQKAMVKIVGEKNAAEKIRSLGDCRVAVVGKGFRSNVCYNADKM